MTSDQEPASDFVTRRSDRIAVESTTHLRSPTRYDIEISIQDISQCGFMAECDQPLGIGSNISLDVPGIGPVHAQVRWQIGGKVGGMFLDPISLSRCEWTGVKAEPPGAG